MERAELIALLRASGCAEEHAGFVFLCDPLWGRGERDALAIAAGQMRGENPAAKNEQGWLCIPTGGSTGGVRFARHDEATLAAAVRGFCGHFAIKRVNAVDVLPPFHVSGLMARMRCAASGGEHLPWDWKRLEAGEVPALRQTFDGWVMSLVPTQLQRLLAAPRTVAWLRSFRLIFLGGGPLWPELAEAAAREKLPLALSYGMTETAAMVAAQKPGDFLAGSRDSGVALPHARLSLNEDGVLVVAGDSLFRGYFPALIRSSEFITEDFARIDEQERLTLLGRRDAVIITGGKKVNPLDVENALRASGQFADVAVVGVPDPEWGEAVVACYSVEAGSPPDLGRAVEGLLGYQQPKRFVALQDWPRNAQGKVNRAALRAAATAQSGR